MGQEQFISIMPYICADLVNMIAKKTKCFGKRSN